ncbi:hypothetical protein B0H14DRAFT_3722492 [Mycena olivaceomarginata]|nr:hypothetical protein B0H14DRAFT_3722492 [Mycena olivaceomarginata]
MFQSRIRGICTTYVTPDAAGLAIRPPRPSCRSQINILTNQRGICNYLDWELTVDNPILSSFKAMVQRDFPLGSKGPPLYKNSVSPMTPDTPTHTYSNTMSPASLILPPMPTGPVDLTARIHEPKSNYKMSPGLSLSSEIPQIHPLKGKMFTFAIPAVW